MAFPAELVATVARAFGLPEASVSQFDRYLADAGLRLRGGKGRSAAKMTPTDAANLMIAAAASDASSDGPANVIAFSTLRYAAAVLSSVNDPEDTALAGPWSAGVSPLPALAALPTWHSFGDALVALVGAVGSWNHDDVAITITLARPVIEATIEIRVGDRCAEIRYDRAGWQPSDSARAFGLVEETPDALLPTLAPFKRGDLRRHASFTADSILAVGLLLKGKSK